MNDAIVFGEHLCNRLHINKKLFLKMCEDSITHKYRISSFLHPKPSHKYEKNEPTVHRHSCIDLGPVFWFGYPMCAYSFFFIALVAVVLSNANYFNQITNYLSHDGHTQNRIQFETVAFKLLTLHNDVINFYEQNKWSLMLQICARCGES